MSLTFTPSYPDLERRHVFATLRVLANRRDLPGSTLHNYLHGSKVQFRWECVPFALTNHRTLRNTGYSSSGPFCTFRKLEPINCRCAFGTIKLPERQINGSSYNMI